MVVGARSHLGQVGHGEHLAVASQLLHEPAHGVGHGPAHTRVHLVEDQRGRLAQGAGGDRDRQRDARQLAARGHLADGPGACARVARHEEGHVVRAVGGRLGQLAQGHLELAAGHAQALHGLGDGGRQPGGALGPRQRQGARCGLVGTGAGGFGLFQGHQVGCGVELLQLGLPAVQQGGQLHGAALVAPRERHPQRQARIHGGQALGVQVVVAQVGVQRMHHVAGLRHGGVEDVGGAGKFGFEVLVVLQQVLRAGEAFQRTAAIVAGQGGDGGVGRIHERRGVGQALVLRVELGPLVIARGQLVDLGDLPLQAFAFLLQGGLGGAGLGQGLLVLAPLVPALDGGSVAGAGVGVEQAAHRFRPGQALPGVLAVDVQQQLTERAQLRGRGGRAVDPAAALALGVHRAAQQQQVFALQPRLFEPGPDVARRVEFGAHVGARTALAHQGSIGAGAEHQLYGVDQDGLAGTGLASEHGEAALQLQLQRLNDDEITQRDAPQGHGQEPPSFQRSFLRRVAK